MPETVLTPSVEQRLRAYHELSGRAKTFAAGVPRKPTITISREFGCEAFPVAEELVKLAEKTTGEQWLLVDISLLNAVAKSTTYRSRSCSLWDISPAGSTTCLPRFPRTGKPI